MFSNIIILLFLLKYVTALFDIFPCPLPAEIVFLGSEFDKVPATYFNLYTRRNRFLPQNLTSNPCSENTNYNPDSKTIIIIHGYNTDPFIEYIMFLKKSFLDYDDCNVITVDWSEAANDFIFPFAIRNTRSTGKFVAEMIESWNKNCKKTNFDNHHVIGMSLGAQTAGFVGKFMKTGKIGRITGLDPAGTCFQGNPSNLRLDRTDAKFVDVISTTTAVPILLSEPTGHLYFKPDGGDFGRGCGDELVPSNPQSLSDILDLAKLFDMILPEGAYSCSHLLSVYFFAASLYSEILPVGYRCKDFEAFTRGECSQCGNGGKQCAAMGIHAEQYASKATNETATMYLTTTFTNDYFLYHYHVEITLGSNANSIAEAGKLVLVANQQRNETVNAILNNNLYLQYHDETFRPGEKKQYLVATTYNIDPLIALQFVWYTTQPRVDSKLYVQCVKIVRMNNLEIDRSSLTTYATTNGEAIPPEEPVLLDLVASC